MVLNGILLYIYEAVQTVASSSINTNKVVIEGQGVISEMGRKGGNQSNRLRCQCFFLEKCHDR